MGADVCRSNFRTGNPYMQTALPRTARAYSGYYGQGQRSANNTPLRQQRRRDEFDEAHLTYSASELHRAASAGVLSSPGQNLPARRLLSPHQGIKKNVVRHLLWHLAGWLNLSASPLGKLSQVKLSFVTLAGRDGLSG